MLPDQRPTRYFSIPVMGFILACLLLAGALSFVTWHNLDREERLMESFLLKEGQTLIRAFEAGARTSMMMGPRAGNLATLVEESAREASIAYILIYAENGRLIAAAGAQPEATSPLPVSEVLAADAPTTRSIRNSSGETIFEVAKPFSPLNALPMRRGTMSRWQKWRGAGGPKEPETRLAIYLGLYTTDFAAARHEDIKQSLILLGTLLLIGSGGLYGLFLSHKSQVAKSALENMELYTDNVIRSMPAGLLTIDNERKIVSANTHALEYFGVPEQEMVGKTLRQLTAPHDCPLAPLLQEGREFIDQPMECLRRDKVSIPLKVSGSHLRDRNGALRGMVLILRDQREIRAMEEAVERSRRHAALGRMAAGIAHEVRNPLGTLRGFAQYFSRTDSKDRNVRAYAELMIGEVDRLNRTVSALLQFSRSREPELQMIDLCSLVHRAAALIRADADTQRIRLHLELPAATLPLPADADLLQQVLLNLLQNSLAATPQGGHITICAETRQDRVLLQVRDSGRGLAPEEQSKIFDPFYTTRKEGTGLGLAVVQQIVEQHKGQIRVESEAGQGTCITLSLPRNGGTHENV